MQSVSKDVNVAQNMDAIEVDLSIIHEDVDNPRKFHSSKEDEAMIESIKARGILQPITIVRDPNRSGHYIVKDGNRRRKNALLAGLKTIPAVIKNEFSELDQLTANIIRDDMTVFDISRSINRLIANKLHKQKEIGTALGYAEAKTSKYVALTKDVSKHIIENLEELYNRGLAKDFSALYEITSLSKEFNEEVTKWLDKHVGTGKSLGMKDVNKLKVKLTTDEEKTEGEKNSPAQFTETVIFEIADRGKSSLDRISKLSKGEIIDQAEREEVMSELDELIRDLKIIQKQYK